MLKKDLEQKLLECQDDIRVYRNMITQRDEIISILKSTRGEDMLHSVSGAIEALAHTVGDLRAILRERK